MTLDYLDLDFTLSNRILVVFWPFQNFYCFCELNETRDRVEATWTSRDTSEARLIADLLKNAGNWYLEELRSSHSWDPRLLTWRPHVWRHAKDRAPGGIQRTDGRGRVIGHAKYHWRPPKRRGRASNVRY
jgi:hypothetical protein